MKAKLLTLAIPLLMFVISSNAQYRVKSVTSFVQLDRSIAEKSHTLSYDGQGKIVSVEAKTITPKEHYTEGKYTEDQVEIRSIPVEYGKNEVKIARDSKYANVMAKIKLNKEGRIEEVPELKIKYDKDGSIKEFQKADSKYEVYYDEHGRMAALVRDKDKALNNILIYYGENNLAKEIMNGMGHYMTRVFPKWNGNRLDALAIYDKDDFLIGKQEFIYNSNNNLIEQIIYHIPPGHQREDQTDKSLKVQKRYVITYEPGSGNDRDIYLKYGDWTVGILLGSQSFDTFTPVRY